jgi:hypothetical protein
VAFDFLGDILDPLQAIRLQLALNLPTQTP